MKTYMQKQNKYLEKRVYIVNLINLSYARN
jgi:hypothetical protein